MIFYLKQLVRFIKIISRYKKAGYFLLLSKIGAMPFFKFKYRMCATDHQADIKSYAYAFGDRSGELELYGKRLGRWLLKGERNVSAFHFFLNRPSRDFFKAIKIIVKKFNYKFLPDASQKVFEPGCGAGRYLGAFVDKYGGTGLGIDVYGPAVQVAKDANINNKIKYIQMDIKKTSTIAQLLDKEVDISFTSSFLVHLSTMQDKRIQLLELMKKQSKVVFGIEKSDDNLHLTLKTMGFQVFNDKNKLIFFIRKNDNTKNNHSL